MDEDEPTRGGYKEALLSAAGKRDRPKAPTGLTPPAKAALGRKETRHKERTNRKCADRGPLDGGGDSPAVERG